MQVGIHDDDEHLCECEGCTQIDLLTAKCTDCGKRFCSNHIAGSAHQCTGKIDVIVPTCPVCNKVVPLEYPRQRADEAVSHHMDRSCSTATCANTTYTSSSPHYKETNITDNASHETLAYLPSLTAFEERAKNTSESSFYQQEHSSSPPQPTLSSAPPSNVSSSYASNSNKSYGSKNNSNREYSSNGATPASVLHSINNAFGKVLGTVSDNERSTHQSTSHNANTSYSNNSNNSSNTQGNVSQRVGNNPFCNVKGCLNQLGVRVLCEDCRQYFCIDHRDPSSHNCPATFAKRGNVITGNNSNDKSKSKFVMNKDNKSGSSVNINGITSHKSLGLFAHKASKNNGNQLLPTALSSSQSLSTSLTTILSNVHNTRSGAKGKVTESPSDMVTPLIVFAITPSQQEEEQEEEESTIMEGAKTPTTAKNKTTIVDKPSACVIKSDTKKNNNNKDNKHKSLKASNTDELLPIPAFYMHCNVNFSLGKVLDLAVTEASLLSASVQKKVKTSSLSMFVITLPVPKEATDLMYPPQSLPILVKKSTLSNARQSLLIITNATQLPNGTVKVVRALQRKLEALNEIIQKL